jgi:hypothetical protein
MVVCRPHEVDSLAWWPSSSPRDVFQNKGIFWAGACRRRLFCWWWLGGGRLIAVCGKYVRAKTERGCCQRMPQVCPPSKHVCVVLERTQQQQQFTGLWPVAGESSVLDMDGRRWRCWVVPGTTVLPVHASGRWGGGAGRGGQFE